MKKKVILPLFLSVLVLLSSCIEPPEGGGLSEGEVVEGLKTALNVGTDSACAFLHKKDGYFGNAAVKILLPKQADVITNVIQSGGVVGTIIQAAIAPEMKKVVLALNRSAENVVLEAGPIFVNAIKEMTIADGIQILNGRPMGRAADSVAFDSIAATHYLIEHTSKRLLDLYKPKMDGVLDKDVGVGFSAAEAWNGLVVAYNGYSAIYPNKAKPIENVELSTFATQKGLDGVFYHIGNQEKQIRRDPYRWALDILQKVFGSLLDKS